jgi:hypothetical protein
MEIFSISYIRCVIMEFLPNKDILTLSITNKEMREIMFYSASFPDVFLRSIKYYIKKCHEYRHDFDYYYYYRFERCVCLISIFLKNDSGRYLLQRMFDKNIKLLFLIDFKYFRKIKGFKKIFNSEQMKFLSLNLFINYKFRQFVEVLPKTMTKVHAYILKYNKFVRYPILNIEHNLTQDFFITFLDLNFPLKVIRDYIIRNNRYQNKCISPNIISRLKEIDEHELIDLALNKRKLKIIEENSEERITSINEFISGTSTSIIDKELWSFVKVKLINRNINNSLELLKENNIQFEYHEFLLILKNYKSKNDVLRYIANHQPRLFENINSKVYDSDPNILRSLMINGIEMKFGLREIRRACIWDFDNFDDDLFQWMLKRYKKKSNVKFNVNDFTSGEIKIMKRVFDFIIMHLDDNFDFIYEIYLNVSIVKELNIDNIFFSHYLNDKFKRIEKNISVFIMKDIIINEIPFPVIEKIKEVLSIRNIDDIKNYYDDYDDYDDEERVFDLSILFFGI